VHRPGDLVVENLAELNRCILEIIHLFLEQLSVFRTGFEELESVSSCTESQLADFLRLGPTPASSDEVGCSAVNRNVGGSNPPRGAKILLYQAIRACG
jgi:hypothetical protein